MHVVDIAMSIICIFIIICTICGIIINPVVNSTKLKKSVMFDTNNYPGNDTKQLNTPVSENTIKQESKYVNKVNYDYPICGSNNLDNIMQEQKNNSIYISF